MVVQKAKPPQEDPETKARRERAERQAEERRERALTDDASSQTNELLRRFGRRAAMAGAGGLASGLTGGLNFGRFGTGGGSTPSSSFGGVLGGPGNSSGRLGSGDFR